MEELDSQRPGWAVLVRLLLGVAFAVSAAPLGAGPGRMARVMSTGAMSAVSKQDGGSTSLDPVVRLNSGRGAGCVRVG